MSLLRLYINVEYVDIILIELEYGSRAFSVLSVDSITVRL